MQPIFGGQYPAQNTTISPNIQGLAEILFRQGCAAAVSADKNSRWGVGVFVRLIVVEHLYLIIESLNDFVKHRMRSLYDESHIFLCRFTFSIG